MSIPGSIGVKVCVLPSDVEEHTLPLNQLTMHFGATSPDDNITFYHTLITSISQAVQEKMENDPIVKSSGAVINTGSWVSLDLDHSLCNAIQKIELFLNTASRLQQMMDMHPCSSLRKLLVSVLFWFWTTRL